MEDLVFLNFSIPGIKKIHLQSFLQQVLPQFQKKNLAATHILERRRVREKCNLHLFCPTTPIICSEACPSPKGFFQSLRLRPICTAPSKIRSGSLPTIMLAPTSTVSGLSVVVRSVTHGIFKIHASSCTPPESVKIISAASSNLKKLRNPTGFVRRKSLGKDNRNFLSRFKVLG